MRIILKSDAINMDTTQSDLADMDDATRMMGLRMRMRNRRL